MKSLLQRIPSTLLLSAALFGFGVSLQAADSAAPAPTVLPGMVVTPSVQTDFSLGTSTYTLSRGQMETIAQGADSNFNQMLIRAPGVSSDSGGQVHFRQEDPYYQYYINGILLPRAINGFGEDVDTRFVDTISLKVGALPAQYAWGNYGIISIQTKTGASLQGGEASLSLGSYDTIHSSVSYGGSTGKTDYYFTGSYLYNDLGIENPTSDAQAIHDDTRQFKGFAYVSHKLSDTSSLSFIGSASHADFQIPNNPSQVPVLEFAKKVKAFPVANSASLNETQTEQSYYGIVAYRQTLDDLSFQVAQVNRYSSVLFRPDENGDLYFNGVAARVFRDIVTNGIQGDFTYQAGAANTIRGGLLFDTERARDHNTVAVFAAEDDDVDPANGELIAKAPPFVIKDNHAKRGYDSTLYLQDEWKATDRLTLNFGGRFDAVSAYVHESQVSPRVSAVFTATRSTTFHAGYARYFIPPPLENVSPASVGKFDDTTNAADQDADDPVKCERSNYFDAGVTQSLSTHFEVGLDGYYKRATNQIDDGQFGAANIFSPYNFAKATIYGVEISGSYVDGSFSAFANFAASQAKARGIVSSEFEFDQDELDYISTHDVYLDQTQFYTASAGVAYAWRQVTIHADVLYGSGMRSGFANTDTLPKYYPVNLGFEYRFKLEGLGDATFRLDATNLFDQSYELNDGTGIGVGAPKFGNRRGIYGGISCNF
ncbi:MAG TPA: TonB-dependent receptor [Opitutaceae bacterium]|jgi:outer membrane receptor protein involved in Fe transport|nr:TonB-dependent receptor [Opitutaceae bacterium]